MRSIKEIGRGGFGIVDEVEYEGQRLARKTFSLNQPGNNTTSFVENVKKRFVREASVQSNIDHYNIVPVISSETNASPPYFLMPLAVSSLDQDIDQNKTLNGGYLEAVMDILSGLEELHSVAIFHRDLKPQNVLKLKDQAGTTRYAIGDFGLMSIKDTQLSVLTQTGMRMGSDYYTAPEIVGDLRRASAVSDIYSVGCILHDFVGTNDRIPCNEIIGDQSDFSDVLMVCTRKDPSRRFQSISALREAILSVDTDSSRPALSSSTAVDFLTLLDSSDSIGSEKWSEISAFVDNSANETDVHSLFLSLSMERIDELIEVNHEVAKILCQKYANWAQNGTFLFARCDGIAARLQGFFQLEDVTCQAEVLLALLHLGTSHNRWYVERKFYRLAGQEMHESLAKRLAIEILVLDREACRLFKHLERSIEADINEFHPRIADAINKICT